jgi:hypothetical protein
MTRIDVLRTYGMRPRTVFAAVASGELFVACGAERGSVDIDLRPGGTCTTSVISGVYTAVASDSVSLDLDDGSHVTITVGGEGMEGSLAVVHERAGDGMQAWWEAGLAALAPPPGRFDADATERQSYEDWLDFYRSVIPGKLRGLSESDARRSLVGSPTTLLGLAKHLTGVERNWFAVVIGQRSRDEVGPNNSGGEDGWQLGPDDTIESVLAGYHAACAESRRLAVRYDLADVVPHARIGEISLRMIYVHMIEEIARHAGHADILRELVDGSTGVDPAGS